MFAGNFSVLTDQTGPSQHTIYQDVSIPFGADPVTLRWADRVRNHAAAYSDNQRFRVEIRSTNNAVLATAFSTQPGDPQL